MQNLNDGNGCLVLCRCVEVAEIQWKLVITRSLLYLGKKQKTIKNWDQQNHLIITYTSLYQNSLYRGSTVSYGSVVVEWFKGTMSHLQAKSGKIMTISCQIDFRAIEPKSYSLDCQSV